MGEYDDLEEIDLTAHHEDGASARRIRRGKQRLREGSIHFANQPRWVRQLRTERGMAASSRKKRTDTLPPSGT